MEPILCSHCATPRDISDNFCRNCGRQLTVNLPAVQKASVSPAVTRSLPPQLVGSVAVLAVGTGLEWLTRRLAGSAARAAGRALIGSKVNPPAKTRAASQDTVIDEVLYVRKIQLRR